MLFGKFSRERIFNMLQLFAQQSLHHLGHALGIQAFLGEFVGGRVHRFKSGLGLTTERWG